MSEDRPPQLDASLVQAFVLHAHGDLAKAREVVELLEAAPTPAR